MSFPPVCRDQGLAALSVGHKAAARASAELARKAESQALPQPYWARACISTTPSAESYALGKEAELWKREKRFYVVEIRDPRRTSRSLLFLTRATVLPCGSGCKGTGLSWSASPPPLGVLSEARCPSP